MYWRPLRPERALPHCQGQGDLAGSFVSISLKLQLTGLPLARPRHGLHLTFYHHQGPRGSSIISQDPGLKALFVWEKEKEKSCLAKSAATTKALTAPSAEKTSSRAACNESDHAPARQAFGPCLLTACPRNMTR